MDERRALARGGMRGAARRGLTGPSRRGDGSPASSSVGRRRAGSLALAAAVAWSCRSEPPPRRPARSPIAEAPPGAAISGASPGVSPAGSGPAAPARTGDPAPGAPAFGPAPSTTPGQIACGDRRCDLASEVCCEDETRGFAECVGKPTEGQYACDGAPGVPAERHCDEKSDCPGDQSCCVTWACTGGCPPVAVCSDVPCLHGQVEQCLPGGTCSPGFRCQAGDGQRPGTCVLAQPGVACGAVRCVGDRPVCCWNARTRSGECARECSEEPDEDRWALHCTTPEDCGGYPCANHTITPLQFSACVADYDVPDRSTLVFCRTLADCPAMNLLGAPLACAPDSRFPGRARTCRFAGG